MTEKTEAQPEALRLANLYTAETWPGGLSLNQWALSAAAELRRQHAEIDRLRALAATCYAGLGGECDLPVIWLDALNDAANGESFNTDGLLPYTSASRAQITVQTNRGAAAEQQVTALTQRLDMANRLNTDARNQLAQQWKCGNEHLPYHPDASHVDPAYRDGWNDCYRGAPLQPEQEPLSELQKQALDMYKPPFQFHHGYIFDSAGHMFADEGWPEEAASLIAVRIRGWGRLGKLSNGAEVQDAAGHLVVAALNAFWKQHAIGAKND